MKALIKSLRFIVLVVNLLILNQVANAQCDITPNRYRGCYGDQLQFEIDPSTTYSTIMWNFGDGDSSNQKTNKISHTYDTFGVFTVCVKTFDASGNIKCGPKCITIHIYDKPSADFILPTPNIMCYKGNRFQFIDNSTVGKNNAPIVFHAWDFGDGDSSTMTNPLKSYTHSGIYTIYEQVVDTNGCTDSAWKSTSIVVLADLAPKFKTTYKISCPTTPVKFDNLTDSIDQSTGLGKCIAKWWWNFGDGSYDSSMTGWNAQITHIYKQDGAFNPVFYVQSCYGCVDSFVFPAGARNIFYWFDIKKNNSGPVCWEGNNVCFEQKPRPNALYWLWTFDDPPSMQDNTDDKTWKPCHKYTAPGFYHITLKIIEPNCVRDTTFCSFIPLKGPQAMIKLPPPAKNSKCQSGKRIPISVFEAAYSKCWNPDPQGPVQYATPQKGTPTIKVDSFYCNAPVTKIDTTLKPGCTDTTIVNIAYKLAKHQYAKTTIDSIQWFFNSWYPGDPYPWVADSVKYKNVYYPPITACNLKNIHDSDQYKSDCRGPNLVFFPNNTIKYRLRYDIDNNAAGFSIPPGNDMSMDGCKNPSYPWASDSLLYFWDFTDGQADACTSTVAKPNVNCMYSTEITPLHLYKKNGCYSPKLMVTDTAMNCISNASVTIPMEPPDAGWDYAVFKKMALAGWDTSERKLDWALQLQMPPAWGRRGMILNGVPCVGQPYPQRPSFSETIPRCDRQMWWMVFDSAAQCSDYCAGVVWADSIPNVFTPGGDGKKEKYIIPDIVKADTNGDGKWDKKIITIAVQCGWIDQPTFAMMGNKWIYGKGGCKTVGLIIQTGDCFDTFWYNEYKYIADLQGAFDILDPKSKNDTTGIYEATLDYTAKQQLRLCPPFSTILTVGDTEQVGITKFKFSIGKSFAAPWTKPWLVPLEDSCKWVQSISYMLCHKDSFTIDPFTKDTTFTNCFVFPNPASVCGVNQLGKATIQDFIARGYIKKVTYKLLDLRDTLKIRDKSGNSLKEPGKYSINSIVTNLYGCSNMFQAELFVGHYTDFEATDQIICYEGGGDTVWFKGWIRYFQEKVMPWDPELNPIEYWLDPYGPRGGNPPAAPYVPERVEWDLNGDGIYGDGDSAITGRADSVFFVYNQPGNYTIRMKTTDSNACEQILERKDFIQVIGVVADFDTAQGVSVCAPQTVKFEDKSYGLNIYQYDYDIYGNVIDSTAVDSVIAWHWEFGDNLGGNRSRSFLKNPIHTYRDNGCFTVSLVVEMMNGCIDTIIKPDFVCIQGPIPHFTLLDSVGCVPFTAFVKDGSSHLKTWEFIKGDNTISSFKARPADSIFALTYNTPGEYYLYLQASDSVFNTAAGKWLNCISTYGELLDTLDPHFKIVVDSILSASFTGDTIICDSATANFDNSTSNSAYTQLSWMWGDETSSETLPKGAVTHSYILPAGSYDKSYQVAMDPLATRCPDKTQYSSIRVVRVDPGIDSLLVRPSIYRFTDQSRGGTDTERKRKITITGLDNPTYFYEYDRSKYQADSTIEHNFMNERGSFAVCEITWIERNGFTGCTKKKCITVKNEFKDTLIIPNVFTPGDQNGVNDKFYIYSKEVEKWELTIMNRWGEKVFVTTNPDEHWNGKRNNTGAECAAGTYYYILSYQMRAKAESNASGTITLIR
jgi:gliding motility-associated-like protein